MTTKGYIFDYGGTLDTGGCHWGRMLWHAYERAAVPVTEQQFREAYVHVERTLGKNPVIKSDFNFRQTLETKIRMQLDYLQGKQISPIDSIANSLVDDLYATVVHQTAHSCEVLRQLKAPMVLVSNFYGNMSVVLHEFCLDGLFLHVVESAVVGVRKPDPCIFKLGVEALGLQPEEVTVVGDSIDKDIIPARKAGCQTVWLQGEQWTEAPVDAGAADRVINDLSELIRTTSK